MTIRQRCVIQKISLPAARKMGSVGKRQRRLEERVSLGCCHGKVYTAYTQPETSLLGLDVYSRTLKYMYIHICLSKRRKWKCDLCCYLWKQRREMGLRDLGERKPTTLVWWKKKGVQKERRYWVGSRVSHYVTDQAQGWHTLRQNTEENTKCTFPTHYEIPGKQSDGTLK